MEILFPNELIYLRDPLQISILKRIKVASVVNIKLGFMDGLSL